MTQTIIETLRSWLFGGSGEEIPSLLLDRHGSLINKDLAAAFTGLLIAMSLTDDVLQESEIEEIIEILRHELALSEDAAEEAVHLAVEGRTKSEELFPKLRILALGMGEDQKQYLLELAIRVAKADDRFSQAEAAIIDRLRTILHLS